MNDIAGIGHNAPTAAEAIQNQLATDHQAWRDRVNALVEASGRVPAAIEDEDTAARVSDFIKQLTAAAKAGEASRVGEKEPHLAAGRAVDGWFKVPLDTLAKAKRAVEEKLGAYLRRKADEERRAREAAAEQARIEAAAAAAAIETKKDLDEAIRAESVAAQAEDRAAAKAADLSRTRGDYGSVASLRTTWDFEVVDAQAVPTAYLMVNEAAIRAAVRAGVREIAGVRIFEKTAAVVR